MRFAPGSTQGWLESLRGIGVWCLLLLPWVRADAFVLIGPADDNEGSNWNYTDPWGAPKDIQRFFRWNFPDFAKYSSTSACLGRPLCVQYSAGKRVRTGFAPRRILVKDVTFF